MTAVERLRRMDVARAQIDAMVVAFRAALRGLKGDARYMAEQELLSYTLTAERKRMDRARDRARASSASSRRRRRSRAAAR